MPENKGEISYWIYGTQNGSIQPKLPEMRVSGFRTIAADPGLRRWANNRVENSHLSFQRLMCLMRRLRRMKTLQKFASFYANIRNHFNQERRLVGRQTYKACHSAALAEWQAIMS